MLLKAKRSNYSKAAPERRSTGGAPPVAKHAAEVEAHRTGRSRKALVMPSSSRQCAPSATCAINRTITVLAGWASIAYSLYTAANSRCSPASWDLSSPRSPVKSALSVSNCKCTETYSPTTIALVPATRAATPAKKRLSGLHVLRQPQV